MPEERSRSGGSEPPLPYGADPDWADVAPVWGGPEEEGAVAIQYDEEHREALAYCRAVLATGERSGRVLGLAGHLIRLNDADYTAWQLRWECCQALGSDLEEEDALARSVAAANSKNYQLWNHRRKLALARGVEGTEQELQVTGAALAKDPKNYHAWAHRQFVVAQAGCWRAELGYVDGLLAQDVRNNSAWNERMFVLRHMRERQQGAGPSLPVAAPPCLSAELAYVAERLLPDPCNESAWNYLWGLFRLPGQGPHAMGQHPEVHTICCEALADSPSCGPALDTLARFYLCLACLAAGAGQPGAAREAAGNAAAALQAACVADPVRGAYWRHRLGELEEGFGVRVGAEGGREGG